MVTLEKVVTKVNYRDICMTVPQGLNLSVTWKVFHSSTLFGRDKARKDLAR
jgi:hypothetical protein